MMKSEYKICNQGTHRVLTRNAVKCLLCDTILESKHRHHFVECRCENQSFVDGGLAYNRVGGKDLDLIENLCEYVEMTDDEYAAYQDGLKLKAELALQKRIDSGEMINIGNVNSPHWVSKKVWEIVMEDSEKYYDN